MCPPLSGAAGCFLSSVKFFAKIFSSREISAPESILVGRGGKGVTQLEDRQIINLFYERSEQAMTAGDENSAYDAESQTLTVSVMFGTDGKQPGEEITVLFNVNGSLDLGSLAVKITDPDTRLVQLSEPIVLTNPVTEKPVTLIGMELRGNQAIWMLETEDAAYFYGDHSSDSEADAKLRQDNIVTWINWLDEQFRATKLYFADGSSCSFNGHEFSDVDGNLVSPHVDYDRLAIDVSQVVSIEINGQTYKIR